MNTSPEEWQNVAVKGFLVPYGRKWQFLTICGSVGLKLLGSAFTKEQLKSKKEETTDETRRPQQNQEKKKKEEENKEGRKEQAARDHHRRIESSSSLLPRSDCLVKPVRAFGRSSSTDHGHHIRRQTPQGQQECTQSVQGFDHFG